MRIEELFTRLRDALAAAEVPCTWKSVPWFTFFTGQLDHDARRSRVQSRPALPRDSSRRRSR
ncbi:MAG: hypothetical protein N2C14_02915, partial [Planctomycetales bacterium]